MGDCAKAALRFLDEIRPVLQVVSYDDSVRQEAERIFRLFIRDKKLSFCDALSYVIVTTILKDIACLSFDEDFSSLGLLVIDLKKSRLPGPKSNLRSPSRQTPERKDLQLFIRGEG